MPMLICNMRDKQAPWYTPDHPLIKLPTRPHVLRVCVQIGGGVALRINITAAAADTYKPQTGRSDAVETDHRERNVIDTDLTSKIHDPRYNNTFSSHHITEQQRNIIINVFSDDRQSWCFSTLHFRWWAWGSSIHICSAERGLPDVMCTDIIITIILQEAPPLKSVLTDCAVHSELHCHHSAAVSVGTYESVSLKAIEGLVKLW